MLWPTTVQTTQPTGRKSRRASSGSIESRAVTPYKPVAALFVKNTPLHRQPVRQVAQGPAAEHRQVGGQKTLHKAVQQTQSTSSPNHGTHIYTHSLTQTYLVLSFKVPSAHTIPAASLKRRSEAKRNAPCLGRRDQTQHNPPTPPPPCAAPASRPLPPHACLMPPSPCPPPPPAAAPGTSAAPPAPPP